MIMQSFHPSFFRQVAYTPIRFVLLKTYPSPKKTKRPWISRMLFQGLFSSNELFISCHELRQIRSIFCDLLRDVKPIRDGHWQSAYADGNHACCFSYDCGVGMFFSFLLCCFLFLIYISVERERSALPLLQTSRPRFTLRHLPTSGCKVMKTFVIEQKRRAFFTQKTYFPRVST